MKEVLSCVSLWVLAVALTLAAAEAVEVEKAGACNPVQLSPCLPAVSSPAKRPPDACCRSLTAQQPCLCGYMRNPAYRQYITSPGAKRVANACRVPVPRC